MNPLLQKLSISLPIIQAPMAGVSTPAMPPLFPTPALSAQSALAPSTPKTARSMISAVRAATDRPFNVNVFCHKPATPNPARESAWISRLAPLFAGFGAKPPEYLKEIYTSFVADDAMLAMLLSERPKVVSFHFGLPQPEKIAALKSAGITLFASATNLDEGRAIESAGIDAVIAQGFEAGGHRGTFDPTAPDDCLGTFALTRLLVRTLKIPVIATGGIMDGAGIAAALALGASAAHLGTAFIACPESSADAGFRAALLGPAARPHSDDPRHLRPPRPLHRQPLHTALGEAVEPEMIPDYPIAYDAGKALNAAAKTKGEFGFGAHLAGQAALLARSLPAADLIKQLAIELQHAPRTL